MKERQENQEKTPSKGNDEPWIEYGKLMQEKAKAHYQAMVEKERAKQQAQQNAKNTKSPMIYKTLHSLKSVALIQSY